tara:strand:+ start:152 stop:472 length:321 start_codon:yes stop_codon:yes gene_type:complete
MYKLDFLDKENDLNKIIKRFKKSPQPASILFISLWDSYCKGLISKLKKKYGTKTKGEVLYIVDSFCMPHSFVIFKTTKIPHLIQLRTDNTLSEDYLPHILKILKLN